MKRIVFLLLLLLVEVYAESPGKSGFAFLKIPDSPRIAVLPATPLADGVDAWKGNPAALAFRQSPVLSASHNIWIAHTYNQSLSFNWKFFGWKLNKYSVDDVERDTSGFPLGEFENSYGVQTFSFGFKMRRYTGVGISCKKITQEIYHENYNHLAWDIGLVSKPNERLTLGILYANFGSKEKYEQAKDPLPATLSAGVRYRMGRFHISSEIKQPSYEKLVYLTGLEFAKTENIIWRAGSRFQDDLTVAIGAEFTDNKYFLDITFLPQVNFNNFFLFSAGFFFH